MKLEICLKCRELKTLTRGYCRNNCYPKLMYSGFLKSTSIKPRELPTQFTKEQEQILIGSMLGDGCISLHPNCKYPYFSLARQLKDIEYLKYEFEIFKDFCIQDEVKNKIIYDKRTKKTYYQVKFITRNNQLFEKYHKLWYGKVKKLPKDLNLTPLVCAIWFCDDGCVCVDKRTNRLKLKLSTHCFTKKENQRLVDIFKKMFNEHFSISSDKGKYYITSADSGTKLFIKYIENDIPLSMKRKITWNEAQFNQSKSPSYRINRKEYDFTEKERQILFILNSGNFSPKKIATSMSWGVDKKSTPSGLFHYLDILFENKIIIKKGILHSYKNPITYSLTKKGKNICKILFVNEIKI